MIMPGMAKVMEASHEEEIYIDVLAGGRLRSPWDLKERAEPALTSEQVRAAVRELTPAEFCVRLVEELAGACEAADDLKEAAFWQMQLDVLRGQLELAEKRRRSADGDGEE